MITQNLFAYCGNNPVNNQDYSGHLFAGTLIGGIDKTIFKSGTSTKYADQLDAFNSAVAGTIKIM